MDFSGFFADSTMVVSEWQQIFFNVNNIENTVENIWRRYRTLPGTRGVG